VRAVISLSRPAVGRLAVIGLAVGVLAASTGCGSASPAAAVVKIARQDPIDIDRSEFEKELKALNDNRQLQAASGGNGLSGAGKKTVDPRLTAGWLTAVIYDKVITREFERRKLQVTPADTEQAKTQLATQFGSPEVADAFPRWFRDRLVARNARAVALRSALSGVSFSEDSLRKYYDEHRADFGQNCVSHILVRSKADADAVRARLRGGEDFAGVARAVSADTGSGTRGGDLGCNPKGTFVPEFDAVASELPVGQLSEAVQTQFGFHVILVTERKQAEFEAAREEIRAALNSQSQTAFRQFLQEAVNTVRVTVDERYGTFEAPATGQAPEVVPPKVPEPNTERTDNTPTTEPLTGEAPDGAESPTGQAG
jgi:foldase protein PrsA